MRAFTLVELIVTISIIALLVSILLPVLAKARRAVDLAVCSSNERQMAIAMTMYANDSDRHRTPYMAIKSYNYGGGGLYISNMVAYVGSVPFGQGLLRQGNYLSSLRSLRCPDDRRPADALPPSGTSFQSSYHTRDDHIEVPGTAEGLGFAILEAGSTDAVGTDHWRITVTAPVNYDSWHGNNTRNIFYADGHVQALTFAITWFGEGNIKNAYERDIPSID